MLHLLLWKVCENERAFLRGELVLFLSGLLQQLLPHHSEHGAQQRPAEDLSGLVAGQAVAELRHVAVAQPSTGQTHCCYFVLKCTGNGTKAGCGSICSVPPCVVSFVASRVIIRHPLASLGGRFQLPVVDLVQKHLSQLHDGLSFF